LLTALTVNLLAGAPWETYRTEVEGAPERVRVTFTGQGVAWQRLNLAREGGAYTLAFRVRAVPAGRIRLAVTSADGGLSGGLSTVVAAEVDWRDVRYTFLARNASEGLRAPVLYADGYSGRVELEHVRLGEGLTPPAIPAPIEPVTPMPMRERSTGPGGGPPPRIAPFTRAPLSAANPRVPMVFPVLGNPRVRYDFNQDRGSHRHTGVDIVARKMTPIVAPFTGVLGFKRETFWVYGDNGYFALGTHLNDDLPGTNSNNAGPDYMFAPNLRPGDRVRQGQFIGYIGDSGWATGPHLHFELFDPQGRLLNPSASLRGAYRVKTPTPVLTDNPPPVSGLIRVDGCLRFLNESRSIASVRLVARQKPDRGVQVFTRPQLYQLRIPLRVIQELGGWDALRRIRPDRALTAYVTEDADKKGGEVRRLWIPSDDYTPRNWRNTYGSMPPFR
jgi:murein DD-endopeptidase MepM/ murein hydrolase activator NlpD